MSYPGTLPIYCTLVPTVPSQAVYPRRNAAPTGGRREFRAVTKRVGEGGREPAGVEGGVGAPISRVAEQAAHGERARRQAAGGHLLDEIC